MWQRCSICAAISEHGNKIADDADKKKYLSNSLDNAVVCVRAFVETGQALETRIFCNSIVISGMLTIQWETRDDNRLTLKQPCISAQVFPALP